MSEEVGAVVGVVVAGTAAVLAVEELAVPEVPAPVLEGAACAGGGFTENWVPVTTVTSAPSVTWEGS
jgi:hypothetical protein